jgi:hypothetical protein
MAWIIWSLHQFHDQHWKWMKTENQKQLWKFLLAQHIENHAWAKSMRTSKFISEKGQSIHTITLCMKNQNNLVQAPKNKCQCDDHKSSIWSQILKINDDGNFADRKRNPLAWTLVGWRRWVQQPTKSLVLLKKTKGGGSRTGMCWLITNKSAMRILPWDFGLHQRKKKPEWTCIEWDLYFDKDKKLTPS